MTAAEFKKKWSRYQGKESAAYQEHFSDLCRLLGQPTPVEADPSGNDFFCFQKRVVKGAEFLNLEHPDCGDPTERGFADVWRKDCFGWEYKGKKKSLDIAYKQLLTEDREGSKELRCLCGLMLQSGAIKLPQFCYGGRERRIQTLHHKWLNRRGLRPLHGTAPRPPPGCPQTAQ